METNRQIIPLILCGGSGTRLWPLSTPAHPKQFVPLIGGRTLFEMALERAERIAEGGTILCVAAESHRGFVRSLAGSCGSVVRGIFEPAARNTAAAIALGLMGLDDDAILLVCPADHHIPDVEGFCAMVNRGVAAARKGAIVTFGVRPDHPSSAYGYIRHRGSLEGTSAWLVERFLEKPSREVAVALLAEGDVLWNAGIFLATAGTLRAAFREHAPDILAACEAAMAGASREGDDVFPGREAFTACRSQSMDYAVLEKHGLVATLPFDGVWSDLGGWRSVVELAPMDEAGNRGEGEVLVLEGSANYVRSVSGKKVVLIGVDGLTVVETDDALLVMSDASDDSLREAARWADR